MKKIVVKIGSSVIAPEGRVDSALISRLVKDVLAVESLGYRTVLVSSGAIACAVAKLGIKARPQAKHALMALASLGQIALMDIYEAKFRRHGKLCAQILLTWEDFDHRRRFMNAKHTIDKLLTMGVVPIINENDAVSFEEIQFGDNDRLSVLVADLIGADMVVNLSNVPGLMRNGKVVKVVRGIDSSITGLVKKSRKGLTAGGMEAKLAAAKIAASSGIKMVIANGRERNVLCRVMQGGGVGTCFFPSRKIGKARKRWIALSKRIKGLLKIDDGAKEALVNRGKSLLNVGITAVEGVFKKGDSVAVADCRGTILGYGIVAYASEDLVIGKKLDKEVVHRDNFVRSV